MRAMKAAMMRPFSVHWRARCAGLVTIAFLGAIWARYVLGPVPLDVHNTSWIWGDLAQVYTAWGQYLADPDKAWLESTRQSYPLPMSVALFDPMPLFLLLARPVSEIMPDGLQFTGWYFLACVVLQGCFGFLAAREVLRHLGESADSWVGLALTSSVALIIATLPFTFHRFQWHTALSSQWVLVLSIWVILRTLDSRRGGWLSANGAVMLLATGINPYLALMVAINVCGIVMFRWRQLGWAVVAERVGFVCLVGAVGLALFGFLGGAGPIAGGYGIYSANLLSPVDSNGLARLLHFDVIDPTGGQASEGFNYLGLGVLLLCVIALALLPILRLRTVAFPFLPALIVVLACYLLALSTTIYVGSKGLHVPVPGILEQLLSRFRASGRFFWLSGFWLVFLSFAVCVLRLGTVRSAALIVIALLVQLVDIQPIARHVKFSLAEGRQLVLQGVGHGPYSALFVYPAWQCDYHSTPLGIRNFEPVGFYALQHGIPTNNFYAARTLQAQRDYHCDYGTRLSNPDGAAAYLLSDQLYRQFGRQFEARFDCREHVNGADSWLCVPRERK